MLQKEHSWTVTSDKVRFKKNMTTTTVGKGFGLCKQIVLFVPVSDLRR